MLVHHCQWVLELRAAVCAAVMAGVGVVGADVVVGVAGWRGWRGECWC